jgi:hypothetical protein
MTRLVGMVMGLILIQPAGATADASAQQADSPGTVVDRRVLMEPLEPTVAFGPLSAEPQQKTAPPPPSDRPRRRGSMVGYIDNPILESKVRIRFDHATQNTVPDRAEYFYAKCGCYQGLSGHPVVGVRALADGQAPGPGPTIVTDLSFQQLYLEGEYAHTPRFSLFAEVPLRWIQPQAFAGPNQFGDVQSEAFGPPSAGGIGDVRAGVRYGLAAAPDQSLTVQLRAFLPTGSAARGLGTDHASLEPALLLYQRASDRLAVEGQIGVWFPLGGSAGAPTDVDDRFAGNVFFYGIGPSYDLYEGNRVRFSPVVELVGWRVLGGFQTRVTGAALDVDAGGTNIVNLKLGGRIAWGPHSSLYVGFGHALTAQTWYEDIVRFEYRHAF